MTVSRSDLLAAREEQESRIRLLVARSCDGSTSLVYITTNVPGPEKDRQELGGLMAQAVQRLLERFDGGRAVDTGRGPLGPYAAVACPGDPSLVKRAAVEIEGTLPGGRLLDLDVYDRKGRALDRTALALPQRSCLVCREPARECIRAGRHSPEQLEEAVRELLARFRSL
ncbi:MAG: citrate lyase holo-[acyl-carrier protein] synthase [Candidatus Eisenbacteria bacterium]|nr:citrate lyase holo-[acyl-carrier protein] synthase [Candidatus Eisenbacteria bacterium]